MKCFFAECEGGWECFDRKKVWESLPVASDHDAHLHIFALDQLYYICFLSVQARTPHQTSFQFYKHVYLIEPDSVFSNLNPLL